uniref:cytochrome P450 n=1 Tax=Nitrospira cf. moscoviensis SBR1015 TaxID=96242 RepID=UPI000B3BC8FE|nr:cytochrome P450 [Nitrospira cf. moscoviensis SBR1015]
MQYAPRVNETCRMTNNAHQFVPISGPPVSRWFGFFSEFRRDSLGFLLRCHAYGDVVKIPMGRIAGLLLRDPDPAMYLLNHPADVRHVLVANQDNYTKAPVPPVESRIFGQGVLHAEGAAHHRQRRLFLPFFHGDHVHSYAGLIAQKTAVLADGWQKGIPIDIGQEMTQLTLSIIWRLLFGQDIGPEAVEVTRTITTGQHLIKKQYDSLFARILPLWIPTADHREFSQGHRRMKSMILQLIQDRRAQPQHTHDVLSLLLAATDVDGHPLGDDYIRDELTTFLLAGHETTASALTWTWLLLSQSPTVRARLADELATVVGDRLPTAENIPHLRYTKMIWDETLRLYPPAWLLHTRVSRLEDRLPSGAHLPSGAMVFLSPWSLQRDPRWFPDPDRFDPDRFSEDAAMNRPAFCYIPFGGGARRCLGESFAEMEGLLIMATVASRVRLSAVDTKPVLPEPLMTLRPSIPVQMRVEPMYSPELYPTET